jgi:uncharacterized Zn finger protein (UPF0148 family)
MKICEGCGAEISTVDGDNRCPSCEREEGKKTARNARARAARRDRAEVMESLGLVKVRGAMGGTYWE